MPGKVTYIEIGNIENELQKLIGKHVIAGVAAEEKSTLAQYAGANEFGAIIRPKAGKKYIAIPLQPEFKGKSPKDIPVKYTIKQSKDKTKAVLFIGNIPAFLLVTSSRIPERAFLRTTLDSKAAIDAIIAKTKQGLRALLTGKASAETILHAIGATLVSKIKSTISSNLPPANSAITLRLKNGDITLIDEGILLKSINYMIE